MKMIQDWCEDINKYNRVSMHIKDIYIYKKQVANYSKKKQKQKKITTLKRDKNKNA